MEENGDRQGAELWFLNRGIVIVRPREPFVEWVLATNARVSGDAIPEEIVRGSADAYLIPEFDYTEESWQWMRRTAR